jgi:hypothetical protein
MSKMSMVEDMETLTTKDSHECDIHALQWVMESLIEDSGFEPFVEGISMLLSGTSQEKIGSRMSKTVLEMMFDRKAKLLTCKVRLLKTCEEPGALVKALRHNHAIVCMDAITSIFHAQGHSVQIHIRYIDNTMTLYHLRHLSGCPADYTLYPMETGQPDNIESK